MRLYSIDERKLSKENLTEVDLVQSCEILLANIRRDDEMRLWVVKTWERAKNSDRVITTGDDIFDQLAMLNKMTTFVATYAPASSFREITTRCTSLNVIRDILKKWAGIRPPPPSIHHFESRELVFIKTDRTKDQVRRKPNHAELSNSDPTPTPNLTCPKKTPIPISRKVVVLHQQREEEVPVVQPELPIHQTPYQPSSISSDSENNEDHEAFLKTSEPDNQEQEGREQELLSDDSPSLDTLQDQVANATPIVINLQKLPGLLLEKLQIGTNIDSQELSVVLSNKSSEEEIVHQSLDKPKPQLEPPPNNPPPPRRRGVKERG